MRGDSKDTPRKQNPRKRVICISLIAQDCNTWVWSKVQARVGVGYPEDLYHRTVFHRRPATIRTHTHSRLVRRPSTPSTTASNKDPRGCPDLIPVKTRDRLARKEIPVESSNRSDP